MQRSMKLSYKLILQFLLGWSNIPKFPKLASLRCLYNISNKKLEMKLNFCMQINIKVDFNTLGIKFSHKGILSLLTDMVKHSQNTQNNNIAISLQYRKKEVRNGVNFWHADKDQSFCQLALSFLMEVARHVQSTENEKLVAFLQYIKKKLSQLLLCPIVMQNIQIFSGGPVIFVVTSCFLKKLYMR